MSKEQRDALDQMIRRSSPAPDLAEQRVGFDRLMRSTPLAPRSHGSHRRDRQLAVIDLIRSPAAPHETLIGFPAMGSDTRPRTWG